MSKNNNLYGCQAFQVDGLDSDHDYSLYERISIKLGIIYQEVGSICIDTFFSYHYYANLFIFKLNVDFKKLISFFFHFDVLDNGFRFCC